MMTTSLQDLSLPQLIDMKKGVEAAIEQHEQRSKDIARAALEEKARELGFSSVTALMGDQKAKSGGKATRTPAKRKYRNPEDHNVTWSGRGRSPLWFTKALESGMTHADLLNT